MYQPFFQRVTNPQQIRDMMTTESTDVITLDYLSALANTDQKRNLWRQLLQRRREHYDWLRGLYYYLTGMYPEVDQETFKRPESYQLGMQDQIQHYQNRLQKLQNLLADATNLIVIQYLQSIINQFQYEGLFLRQLERFQ